MEFQSTASQAVVLKKCIFSSLCPFSHKYGKSCFLDLAQERREVRTRGLELECPISLCLSVCLSEQQLNERIIYIEEKWQEEQVTKEICVDSMICVLKLQSETLKETLNKDGAERIQRFFKY